MCHLRKEILTVDNREAVHRFSCADNDWGRRAELWIKAPTDANYGAFYSMRQFGTTAWLYLLQEDDQLVGIGSLGTTKWPYPGADDPRLVIGYIPQMAVDEGFRGITSEPDGKKFSHHIIQDLIGEAVAGPHQYLGLHVHPDNGGAVHLYEKHGFSFLPERVDGHGNKPMILRLK